MMDASTSTNNPGTTADDLDEFEIECEILYDEYYHQLQEDTLPDDDDDTASTTTDESADQTITNESTDESTREDDDEDDEEQTSSREKTSSLRVSLEDTQSKEVYHIDEVHANDIREVRIINKFFGSNANKCCVLKCNERINKAFAILRRQNFQELEKSSQDTIILHYLQAHRRISALKDEYGQDTKRGSSQITNKSDTGYRKGIRYFFADVPVCQAFFFFIYDIGLKRFKNLLHHYDEKGTEQRVHRSTGQSSCKKDALTVTNIEHIVQFIRSHAEKFAIPLPGRMAHFKNYKVVLLPASQNKAALHRKYTEEVMNELRKKAEEKRTDDGDLVEIPRAPVKYSRFVDIWNLYVPYIVTSKPASDLCGTCRGNTQNIIRSARFGDEKKNEAIQIAAKHLAEAAAQRTLYNMWRKRARAGKTFELDGEEQTFNVLSFDFAEGVHYPSSSRAVGSEYFASARKCGIFDVHDERTRIQTNYLIDEADSIGKGADVVINLLHHYLQNIKSDVIILFADNCVGQNKNNAVMQYLMWRMKNGYHRKIELHFMIAGHTKFSCDRSFGLFKYHYARSDVNTLDELVLCVNESSPNGYNVAIPTILNGHRNVTWFAWSEYLGEHFKKIALITRLHKFVYSADCDSVAVGELGDSQLADIHLVRESFSTADALVIEELLPTPLTPARQWYLFEVIRPFVTDESKKDFVAPRPKIPKPTDSQKKDFRKEKTTAEIQPRKPQKERLSEPSTSAKPEPSTSAQSKCPKQAGRKRQKKVSTKESTAGKKKPALVTAEKPKRGRPRKRETSSPIIHLSSDESFDSELDYDSDEILLPSLKKFSSE